jgi:adenylylsulfate kinase-like enzyme
MYAKARRGEIKAFTGIDDPYEAPEQPEISLNTVTQTPEDNAQLILHELVARGFVRNLSEGQTVLGTNHLS